MTTVVIDVQNCKVYSDSRGTQSDEKFSIKSFGCVTEESYDDNTQKIFKVGNHVVTGSGSLILLEYMVDRVRSLLYHTPQSFYVKSEFDLTDTSVYICRKYDDKLTGVKLILETKRMPLTKLIKVKITKEILSPNKRFYASGSGNHYAIGALQAKATPEEAIDIAIKFDKYSGGDIQEVSL